MIVREIFALFGFKTDKESVSSVESTLNGVVKFAKVFGVTLGAGAAAEGLRRLVVGTAQLGDEIATTADRIGIGRQALQELRFAADRADVAQGELDVGLRTLAKRAFDAASGGKEMVETFARIGVSATDSSGKIKPLEALFPEIADGLSKVESNSERVAIAQELLGRSGTALIPLFRDGRKGLEAYITEAQRFAQLNDELIAKSEAFDDSQKDLRASLQGVQNIVGEELLPAFTESADAVRDWILANKGAIRSGIKKFVEAMSIAFKVLAASVNAVVEAVRFFGRVIAAVAKALVTPVGAASAAVVVLALSLTSLGQLLIWVGLQFVLMGIKAAAAWIAATFPLILTAALIGIIIAAVLLLIEDFVAMGEGAESVTGTMIQGFQDLVAELGSIPAAIGAMLKEAFVFWLDFFGMTRSEAEDFVSNLGQMFVDMWESLKDGFLTTVKFWGKLFDDFVAGAVRLLSKIPGVSRLLGGEAPEAGVPGAAPGAVLEPPAVLPVAPAIEGRVGGVSNNQETSIDVSINAQGATNPEEIGASVARQVGAEMESRNREALEALTPALAPS